MNKIDELTVRLKALLPQYQNIVFIYEDGRKVDVGNFLEAVKQSRNGKGLVDVLGATEGQKGFLLAAQCDISTLWES